MKTIIKTNGQEKVSRGEWIQIGILAVGVMTILATLSAGLFLAGGKFENLSGKIDGLDYRLQVVEKQFNSIVELRVKSTAQ